ncbi:MAG TPA: helix-turn-helix domain-containing protein [Mycobacterium sp.]|nr:helix-turn-helix domain-containing protein [Mycobacterium sp.]HTX95103.1 helix-turn-helix domain-containing protein [Mycobacterium sp.]
MPPESTNATPKNLGTAKDACALAHVNRSTLRGWVRRGLISAVRVGNGPFRYDLDEVAAMVIEYPRDDVDERIRELVDGAPDFTPQQINRIRLLLHATEVPIG